MNFEQAFEEFKIYASKRHKKQCFDTLSQNYKNNTNKNIYCSFNSFLRFCVLNSYIDSNLLSVVGCFKKKIEVSDHQVYTLFDYFRFRKGLDNRVYRYFFDLLFFHGLRSGEAMALKFSDLSGKRLHICKSIQRRGKRLLDTPKTSNSDRFLSLGIILRFELFILNCYYVKRFGDDTDYFIFGGISPLSPTSINRYKHLSCIKTGIREIITHEFSHSYATRMIKIGDLYGT